MNSASMNRYLRAMAVCCGVAAFGSALSLALLRGSSIVPAAGGPSTAISAAHEQELSDARGLSMDQLIAMLPVAGEEVGADGEGYAIDARATEFERRLAAGARLNDDQWRAVIANTRLLRWRERWPVTHDYYVGAFQPRWGWRLEFRFAPRGDSLDAVLCGTTHYETCGVGAMGRMSDQQVQRIGLLPQRTHALVYDVTVVERATEPGPPTRLLWRGSIETPVKLTATLDEALPPLSAPSLAAALRERLVAQPYWVWGEVEPKCATQLRMEINRSHAPELATVGLSLRIDVLRDGNVVESHRMPMETWDVFLRSGKKLITLGGVVETALVTPAALADSEELARWSFRLVGIPDGALTQWNATSWWTGEVTVPAAEAFERGKPRRTAQQ